MKYYIKRELNEYGPYTLADLQRYVAQGNIQMTDLTRSEGLEDWVPVSQVIGNIPVPVPPAAMAPATGTVYGGAPTAAGVAYGGAPGYGAAVAPATTAGPVPPDFHWALVFVISFFCSIFQIVWLFIEAGFVKKIKPDGRFLPFLIIGISALLGSFIFAYGGVIAMAASGRSEPPVRLLLLCGVGYLAGIVLYIIGVFKMRDAIQEYYNTVEPINLRLSGVMTFFFNILYFQYHFTRIAQWKKTGILQPQG
jgi:GYF domain 2